MPIKKYMSNKVCECYGVICKKPGICYSCRIIQLGEELYHKIECIRQNDIDEPWQQENEQYKNMYEIKLVEAQKILEQELASRGRPSNENDQLVLGELLPPV